MSKIGRLPISLVGGAKVEVTGKIVKITGPKGSMEEILPRGIEVNVEGDVVTVVAKGKSKTDASNHGTMRALINNDVTGVTKGWSKQLELIGTGFRAEIQGKVLVLTIGYSHPVKITAPEGISFKIEKNVVTVEGIDREVVGQTSAVIRASRPPEPYKGKGIKYSDEVIRRKAGKAAAKTAGAA